MSPVRPLVAGLLLLVVAIRPAAPAPAHVPAAPARPEVLPFIADDYDRALARAKTRHLPLFVESWAPW